MAKLNQAYFTTASGGGKQYPIHDAPEGVHGINRFAMRTGASRYGRGSFCMIRSDYDDLVSAAGKAAQATLVLTGTPGPGLSISVILAMSEGLVQSVSSDDSTDMVKVTVFDVRCKNFNPVKRFYNVMQQDFPQSSGKTKCYSSTLSSSSPWSWHDLIKESGAFLEAQIPTDIPSWNPYNLIWDGVPFARVSDDIAARLYCVVGFDHQKSTAGNNYGLTLHNPGEGFAENDQTFQQAVQYQTNGSDADRNNNRLPGKISVSFQAYNADDPTTDPYAHRSYEKEVTTGGGSTDIVVPLHVSENVAIWQGGAWANQSDLDAIATDLAPRAFTFISQDFAQYEFPGIWPFKPDGSYRQVEWVSDQNGARTLVRKDNGRDWSPTDALNDPIVPASNQEVVGIGGMNFAIGAGGTKVGWGGGSDAVKVKVGTNIFAGFYNGTIYTGQLDDESADQLTLPMGLTAGQSCLLVVTEEDQGVVDGFGNAPADKQRLMNGSYLVGSLIGMSGEGTPRPMVLVRGGVGSMSSATTIDPTPTQTTADSTTWTRALTGTPVNLYIQTRMAYDSGAKVLSIFQRQVSYDARGLCYRVGPEEKITVMSGC